MNASYDQKCSHQASGPIANSQSGCSDKENVNLNSNVMPNPQVDDHSIISGIKALSSDKFLSKFEKVQEDFKNPHNSAFSKPIRKAELQALTQKSGQEDKDQELGSLNVVLKNLEVSDLPVYDPAKDYKALYWAIYASNQELLEELKEAYEFSREPENQPKNVKDASTYSENLEQLSGRKKHIRRTAKEISKNEDCPYAGCGKKYGSEGSLNLHMKLKHAAGNKTDREKLAKTLVVQYSNKKPLPSELSINLPPGLIDEASKDYNINLSKSQLKELQKQAEGAFNTYLERCREAGNLDPSTGMPSA